MIGGKSKNSFDQVCDVFDSEFYLMFFQTKGSIAINRKEEYNNKE